MARFNIDWSDKAFPIVATAPGTVGTFPVAGHAVTVDLSRITPEGWEAIIGKGLVRMMADGAPTKKPEKMDENINGKLAQLYGEAPMRTRDTVGVMVGQLRILLQKMAPTKVRKQIRGGSPLDLFTAFEKATGKKLTKKARAGYVDRAMKIAALMDGGPDVDA